MTLHARERTPEGTGRTGMASVRWAGRTVQIEHQWVGTDDMQAPLMVFLHEGLGSVSLWRDFPAQLCQALGCRGLVYSRPGYGRSTPRAPDERWAPDFMHRQALELLPALLEAVGVGARESLWLLGHSDGGSIALISAAHPGSARAVGACGGPGPAVAGVIVLAPHLFVEEVSLRSIEAARQAYEQGELRSRLARHHGDPDSAFWGWNRAWLDRAFRSWSIEAEIAAITCPLLAVQGLDDEYGTLEQIRRIQRQVPHAELLELPACGHSPHRDQPAALIERVRSFWQRHHGYDAARPSQQATAADTDPC